MRIRCHNNNNGKYAGFVLKMTKLSFRKTIDIELNLLIHNHRCWYYTIRLTPPRSNRTTTICTHNSDDRLRLEFHCTSPTNKTHIQNTSVNQFHLVYETRRNIHRFAVTHDYYTRRRRTNDNMTNLINKYNTDHVTGCSQYGYRHNISIHIAQLTGVKQRTVTAERRAKSFSFLLDVTEIIEHIWAYCKYYIILWFAIITQNGFKVGTLLTSHRPK